MRSRRGFTVRFREWRRRYGIWERPSFREISRRSPPPTSALFAVDVILHVAVEPWSSNELELGLLLTPSLYHVAAVRRVLVRSADPSPLPRLRLELGAQRVELPTPWRLLGWLIDPLKDWLFRYQVPCS